MEIRSFSEAGASFESGFTRVSSRRIPAWRIAQFAESLGNMMRGRQHPVLWLHENQARSDFPLLMADTIDRGMLAGYQEYPVSYPLYSRATIVADFRPAKRFAVDGAEGILEEVAELGPYPPASLDDSEYTVRVKKYGKVMGFSMEAWINDDLNGLKDTPMRFGRGARRNREYRATQTFASSANQALLYTVANANQVITANGARTNNPSLGVDGVMSALTVMTRLRDADGQPINVQGAVLVYPPNLQLVAEQVQNALQIITDLRGGTAGTAGSSEYRLEMRNFLASKLKWVANSQLPLVNATNGETGWYIFANPNENRPALMVAELRGRQAPQLFMKSPNAVPVGGSGLVDPMDGSFENDSLEYKIRDFTGSAQIDPKATVFSNGTNS